MVFSRGWWGLTAKGTGGAVSRLQMSGGTLSLVQDVTDRQGFRLLTAQGAPAGGGVHVQPVKLARVCPGKGSSFSTFHERALWVPGV